MKTLGRLLSIVILLVLVGAAVIYGRPVWFGLQRTHLGLFLSHIQSNYVLTPEGRVHYYEAEPRVPGGGIPVVLIHGLADRSESWAPMMRQLRHAGFHVYAPDLLGYGRSPKSANSDYSIATQTQFVADFIQSLGLQKTDVAGWSMGGWIALKLALEHPEMVDRVAVYDSAGVYFPGAATTSTAFHPQSAADVQHLFGLMEPTMKPMPQFVAKDVLRHLKAEAPVIDASVASMMSGNDALDFKLPKLTEPLLIVWGSADQLVPPSVGKTMHTLVPASELDTVTGCGHLAPKTCPRAVAKATVDFFTANPAPVGGERTLSRR